MRMPKLPVSQVKHMPYYGRNFPFLPWKLTSKLRVSLVFAKNLIAELGLVQSAVFWIRFPIRLMPVYKRFRNGFRLMRKQFGLIAEIEWILLVIIFRALENAKGKEKAYDFAKKALQECSQFMMNDFYQADHFSDYEDPYEAFWCFHKAMFQDDCNYPNEFIENKDLKIMVVYQCRNCEIASLTIPELASLGCDHDITGYRAIEDKANMEFRRPVTIAKDGKPCRFMFYRRGTAPKGDFVVH